MSTLQGANGRQREEPMVVVSIRSPFYDEEAGEQRFRQRVTVIAQGNRLEIQGESALVADGMLPVIDMATGQQVAASEDAEAWARNLPYAFRAGDIIADILVDTTPTTATNGDVESDPREPPTIPDSLTEDCRQAAAG
jgi:hypothetical protein